MLALKNKIEEEDDSTTRPASFNTSLETPLEEAPLPKNIGHLQEGPTECVCPACGQKNQTKVRLESVTCLQQFLRCLNCCLCCEPIKWQGRFDNNHYCSICGCYIGRYITLSRYKRALFKMQRNDVEEQSYAMFQRVEKKELDNSKMGLRKSNQ